MYLPLLALALVPVNGVQHSGGQSSWWARVGDGVFRAPLGADIGEYFYAYGSRGALAGALESHRVAGQGRLHVFHLPGGANATLGADMVRSLPTSGGRRTAVSLLQQLRHGMVLNATFPPFAQSNVYRSPLSFDGQSRERSAASLISPEGVESYLKAITSIHTGGLVPVPTRAFNSPARLKAVSYLQKQLRDMGYSTCEQKFTVPLFQQTNVIARLPGAAGGGDSVTVGAHYDSRPFMGAAPGAIDNGSGVAALLAIASAMKKANIQPMKTVYFAAFAGEEMGLLGSSAFANALKKGNLPSECVPEPTKGADHKAIIMDEIAWKSPKLGRPTVNLEAHDWATDVLSHLGAASADLNGENLYVEHSSNPFGSDHMSFLGLGMQAVLTIHGDDEAYPDYHKLTDTTDKADYQLLADIAKMNLGALMRLAGVQGGMVTAPAASA